MERKNYLFAGSHANRTELKKRTITLSLTTAFVVVGLLGLFKLNKDFLLLWNANSVFVTTEDSLTEEKVKIEFGVSVNTINRKNDLDLFSNRSKYIVLYDGEVTEPMFNEYGENDFLLTYDDQCYLSFRQFKFNRRHQHNYHFHFYEKGDTVFAQVDISGQDAMKFERPMIEIGKADEFVCNTPIDSAGGVYNMIELKKK